jgi:hypothetical protein
MRAAIKQALIGHREVPDERWALLPLVPLLPKRLFARMVSVAAGGATSVVSSNLGALNPAANRPDGTDADYFAMKSLYPGITKATMTALAECWRCFRGESTERSSSPSLPTSRAARKTTCDKTFRTH